MQHQTLQIQCPEKQWSCAWQHLLGLTLNSNIAGFNLARHKRVDRLQESMGKEDKLLSENQSPDWFYCLGSEGGKVEKHMPAWIIAFGLLEGIFADFAEKKKKVYRKSYCILYKENVQFLFLNVISSVKEKQLF